MSGSKCAMISRALSTSASPFRSRCGRVVSARLYSVQTAGPDHVEVPRKRPPSPPPRRPCPPTWCRRKAPGVSAFLKSKITATATMKTRTFIGPDFFSARKKRSRAMKLALGLDVQTNAKGGKFMSIEDSRQGALVCKADVEVLWEPAPRGVCAPQGPRACGGPARVADGQAVGRAL